MTRNGVDALAPPPRAGDYRCIVIDPPWDRDKTGLRKARPNQTEDLDYPTMTFGEIVRLDVANWAAANSFLWLWAINSRSRSSGRPILQQAFNLMEEWGFRYYTALTWDKGTGPCPFGPYQITTEHCLFGYRGKFRTPRDSMGRDDCEITSGSKIGSPHLSGVAADSPRAPQGRRLPAHEAHIHPAAAGRQRNRQRPRRVGTGRSPRLPRLPPVPATRRCRRRRPQILAVPDVRSQDFLMSTTTGQLTSQQAMETAVQEAEE